MKQAYHSGANVGVNKDTVGFIKQSVRNLNALRIIKEYHPDAPVFPGALTRAVGDRAGAEMNELDRNLDNRYTALTNEKRPPVPPQILALVWLDTSAHAEIEDNVLHMLRRQLDKDTRISYIDDKARDSAVERLLQKGVMALGYDAAMRAYISDKEASTLLLKPGDEGYDPEQQIAHPMDLWRAVTQLRTRGLPFSEKESAKWRERRRDIIDSLAARKYQTALKQLQSLDDIHFGTVSQKYLRRAQNLPPQAQVPTVETGAGEAVA